MIIAISVVTTLLIALPSVDNAMSSLSVSGQEVNATQSNETDEARKLYDEGDAFLKLKKFNEAIGLFDKSLAINPNDTDVLNDKGVTLAKLDKFNEAIGLFDKSLAINPNNAKTLSEKGDALLN